eukprot:350129_1
MGFFLTYLVITLVTLQTWSSSSDTINTNSDSIDGTSATADDCNSLPNEYFSLSYIESREKFLAGAEMIYGKKTKTKYLVSLPITNNVNITTQTYIDILYLPGVADNNKLVIHISGVHGVEAYAGTAIQIALLNDMTFDKANQQILYKDTPLQSDVILIHALNPTGMHLNRRFTQDNIDLNRNFLFDETIFDDITVSNYINNVEYLPFKDFLYEDRVTSVFQEDVYYWFQTVGLVTAFGFIPVAKATIQGQYYYDKGLFYGGNKLAAEIVELDAFFANNLNDLISKDTNSYDKLTIISVHTGLGDKGIDLLFVDTSDEFEQLTNIMVNNNEYSQQNRIQFLLDTNSDDNPDNFSNLYKDQLGSLCLNLRSQSYFAHNIDDILCFEQEFGTLQDAEMLVIQAIRAENIAFHNEFNSFNHKKRQIDSRDVFYLYDDVEWKNDIIKRGLELFAIVEKR